MLNDIEPRAEIHVYQNELYKVIFFLEKKQQLKVLNRQLSETHIALYLGN